MKRFVSIGEGYRLGLRCLELGRHVAKSLPILELSRPPLRELCQATWETVNLAVPYLHEGIILEADSPSNAPQTRSPATGRGRRFCMKPTKGPIGWPGKQENSRQAPIPHTLAVEKIKRPSWRSRGR